MVFIILFMDNSFLYIFQMLYRLISSVGNLRNLQEDLPRRVKSSITAKELNAHTSVMVRCPQYFGDIVNFMSVRKG